VHTCPTTEGLPPRNFTLTHFFPCQYRVITPRYPRQNKLFFAFCHGTLCCVFIFVFGVFFLSFLCGVSCLCVCVLFFLSWRSCSVPLFFYTTPFLHPTPAFLPPFCILHRFCLFLYVWGFYFPFSASTPISF